MIALSWRVDRYDFTDYDADKAVAVVMDRFKSLPRHIARKHIGAAMRRVLKPGVPILRKNTPPMGTRRGRRKKGEKPISTGAMRRAVTTRTGQTGRNEDGFVWGVLGYRASFESRKAIWHQYGTRAGLQGADMIGRTMREFGQPAANKLAAELAVAFDKAAKENASGKNPGYGA